MKIGVGGALVAASTLLALASCVGAPPTGSAEACAYHKVAELPLTFKNGVPTLGVTIDGAPARFVLDTGAVATTLFDPAVARMNLNTDWSRQYSFTGSNGLSVRKGVIAQRLQIGPLLLADQPLGVAPISPLVMLDGLLGGDILRRYDIDYDASRRLVTLYSWRDCPAGKPDWQFPYRVVAIEISPDINAEVLLPVKLGSQDMRAKLDTGASSTGLNRDAAMKAGFGPETFADDPVGSALGVGTSSLHAVRHKFDELTIAGEVLHNVTLSVREPAPLAGIGSAAATANMLVGEDWLRTRRVWLSYASHRLYVAPTIAGPGTPVQTPFDSSP